MSIESFRRIDPAKYKEAPEWFIRFIGTVNRHFEDVITLLQGGLTSRNENSELIPIEVKNAQEEKIDHPNVRSAPEEVRIVYSETALTSFRWYMSAEGQVAITCTFSGSPAGPQRVHVYVRGS
ncbi:MAG: hypothetical protein ACYTAN_13700 [Planctomycetota bacterium]|jgi:hypothetical protein